MRYKLAEQNQDCTNALLVWGLFFRKQAELQQKSFQIHVGTDSRRASGLGNDSQILKTRHKPNLNLSSYEFLW